jgi:hypothetical protein
MEWNVKLRISATTHAQAPQSPSRPLFSSANASTARQPARWTPRSEVNERIASQTASHAPVSARPSSAALDWLWQLIASSASHPLA